MKLLVYDGTWDGFLCAVFAAYTSAKGQELSIVPQRALTGPMLFDFQFVQTEDAHARRIENAIHRWRDDAARWLYHALLSEWESIEDALLKTLRIGFEAKRNPLPMRHLEPVHRVNAAIRRVGSDTRYYLGFVRFVCLGDDVYAADIRPDTNVLPLIADHFHERFHDQRLIIRDMGRKVALVSHAGNWFLSPFEDMTPLPRDGEFERLWQGYFQNIANPARVNERLQRGLVPYKYREYLTEFM